MNDKKMYEKSWFVILMLVLFFPVGLYLMWKYTEWKKFIKVIISTIFALYVLMIILGGTMNQSEISNIDEKAQVSEVVESEELPIEPTQTETESEDVDFLTSGEWAMYDQPYMFGVEISDFDGDNYKAGEYSFVPEGATGQNANNISAIYDIYVSDKEYVSSSDTVANEEIACSAGGMSNEECDLSLKKGNYVYVIPTDNVNGASGWLSINIK